MWRITCSRCVIYSCFCRSSFFLSLVFFSLGSVLFSLAHFLITLRPLPNAHSLLVLWLVSPLVWLILQYSSLLCCLLFQPPATSTALESSDSKILSLPPARVYCHWNCIYFPELKSCSLSSTSPLVSQFLTCSWKELAKSQAPGGLQTQEQGSVLTSPPPPPMAAAQAMLCLRDPQSSRARGHGAHMGETTNHGSLHKKSRAA